MVTVYMMTNNYSLHILKASAYFFNKNWSNKIHVKVLGFKHPPFRLPPNFRFISLGKQGSFSFTRWGKRFYYWTNSMIPFIRNKADSCFVLLWDEHLIISPIDRRIFNELFSDVSSNRAQKAILSTVLNKGKFSHGIERYRNGMIKIHQRTKYRTTLMPAIWRKEYLLRYMSPNLTAWDFETTNITKSQRDGATIIAPKYKDTLNIFNVYLKGKFNRHGFLMASKKLSHQDTKVIRESSKKWIY